MTAEQEFVEKWKKLIDEAFVAALSKFGKITKKRARKMFSKVKRK